MRIREWTLIVGSLIGQINAANVKSNAVAVNGSEAYDFVSLRTTQRAFPPVRRFLV